MAIPDSVLALDVGEQRIGIAVSSFIARLPRPLTTLQHGNKIFSDLQDIIEAEHVTTLVIGLPRGLSGQYTAQTAATEAFADQLRHHFKLPLQFQDEALTSKKAEKELNNRAKPYKREEIDALAATYILEDFLNEHPAEASHADTL